MKNILASSTFANTASIEDIPLTINIFLISPFIKAINIEKKRQIKETSFKLSVKCSLVIKSISKSFLLLFLIKKLSSVQIFTVLSVTVKKKTKEYVSEIPISKRYIANIVKAVSTMADKKDVKEKSKDLLSFVKNHVNAIQKISIKDITSITEINS